MSCGPLLFGSLVLFAKNIRLDRGRESCAYRTIPLPPSIPISRPVRALLLRAGPHHPARRARKKHFSPESPPARASATGDSRGGREGARPRMGWLEGFCDVCCLYSCLRLFSRFHVDSPILYFFFLFSFDPAPVSSVHVHTTRSPHGDPCLRCDKILPSSYYI